MSNINAMLLIGTKSGTERKVYDELNKHDEIEFVNELFGTWDIIAKIQTESVERMDEFVSDIIRNIKGVDSTMTLIVSR
ncbi:Lrp/AsnC ligand binding domain-containing protein [Candidatus Woesearchaeota archaeon]|jgi:DNA-binding Lrp family transcriptional regulator|nr:Lrp/AsnC ligand binding domain-containing protein [Candidatus Woesearchaeota archaeon]MBT6023344.1 Lrp/AsnC ligand binding domain-containing protein [Candidatus Woesearchaeota archaeon]